MMRFAVLLGRLSITFLLIHVTSCEHQDTSGSKHTERRLGKGGGRKVVDSSLPLLDVKIYHKRNNFSDDSSESLHIHEHLSALNNTDETESLTRDHNSILVLEDSIPNIFNHSLFRKNVSSSEGSYFAKSTKIWLSIKNHSAFTNFSSPNPLHIFSTFHHVFVSEKHNGTPIQFRQTTSKKNHKEERIHYSENSIENLTSLPILHIKESQSTFTNLTENIQDQNPSMPDNVASSIESVNKSTTTVASFTTTKHRVQKELPELLPTPLPLNDEKAQITYNHSSYYKELSTTSPTRIYNRNSNVHIPLSKYRAPIRLMSRSFINPYQSMSSFHSHDSHPSSSFSIPSTPATFFDPHTLRNVTAQMGTSVYIPCKIRNLGNKTVSWIRNRDSHILTVGRYIFIADARFDVWHEEDADTWILHIKYVQERDKGSYECQVSTEPKMNHFVYFNVISPLVSIPGGTDIHVKVGSTVSIKCFITNALQQPQYIFWYKGKERVVDERSDGPKIFLERITNDTSVGTLVIPNAAPSDAGLYQCVPEKLKPANVTLHVINGEHPAAMQHCTSVMISPGSPTLLILSLVLLAFVQIFAHYTLFLT